jgi:hypothetical protein
MENRFKGFCYGCEDFVPAGEGIYTSGEVFCTEPVDLQQVPESLRDRYKLTVKRWAVCWKRVNEILGTDFATVEDLLEQTKAEYEANKPTPEEIAANRAAAKEVMKEDAKKRRQELADFKKRNVCPRCHGAGGSDAWLHTGWTCHRCFGSGKYA